MGSADSNSHALLLISVATSILTMVTLAGGIFWSFVRYGRAAATVEGRIQQGSEELKEIKGICRELTMAQAQSALAINGHTGRIEDLIRRIDRMEAKYDLMAPSSRYQPHSPPERTP
jgi:hypothetical protein